MLGLAYFRSEQYSPAVDAYQEALKSDPANAEWKSMLEKCQQNVIAHANISIPDIAYSITNYPRSQPIVLNR